MNFSNAFRRLYVTVPSTDDKSEDGGDISETNSDHGLLNPRIVPKAIHLSTYLFRVSEIIMIILSIWMFVVGLGWQLQADSKCYEITNFYCQSENIQLFSCHDFH